MAAPAIDYYQVLGVPRDATQKDISAAFRRLARELHPDVNPGDRASEERFKQVSEANEVLSDPEKRRHYDAFGADWRAARDAGIDPNAPRGPRPGPGGVRYQTAGAADLNDLFGDAEPYSDFFHDLFGARGQRGPRAPAEVEATLPVSLSEAFRGASRTVTMPGGKRMEIKVPAGVADGTVLRVPGLRARVQVAEDPLFTREGADLRVQVTVPLRTALLGGEVDVPTLKGTRVKLAVPPGTQNGTRLRLRGLGMPLGGGGAGDLHAEVRVQLPQMDDRLRAWASEMPDA